MELTANPDPRAPETAARLISFEQEARLFSWLRRRAALAVVRQTLFASRLRLALLTVLSLVFWLGLLFLFYEGFQFLGTYLGRGTLYADTVRFIYDAFFASLMVMLVFSSAIIMYGALFRSPETRFLLTLPVTDARVVIYKFQETLFFSSWGFVLLGSPMLVAYGAAAGSPWYYYLLVVPFMVAFVFIPCTVGTLCCLMIVRWIPRLRLIAVVAIAAALIGLGALFVASLVGGTGHEMLSAGWFEEMLSRLEFSWIRLLPSWWLSTGLLEAGWSAEIRSLQTHPLAESVKFLVLLISNALVCHLLVAWVGARVLRSSYSGQYDAGPRPLAGWLRGVSGPSVGPARRTAVGPESPPRNPSAWIDRTAMALTGFLSRPVQLLIVKDLRVFRRDPVQWSQFLIFFGLLGLYFVNIRKFDYGEGHSGWLNMVSFLNLGVVGLILSTFTTRFVFPMISLEGSRFWILGLLPLGRDSILWGKFYFATAGSVLPCTLLILLSDLMLRVETLIVVVHQLVCLVLCFGLSGIAVGLGAKMPDLREQSPSKIAAGFGGTLNLVISAAYIVAVVVMTAVPCHFYMAAQDAATAKRLALDPQQFRLWIYTGAAGAMLLGALATVIPLRIGLKAFRRMEF